MNSIQPNPIAMAFVAAAVGVACLAACGGGGAAPATAQAPAPPPFRPEVAEVDLGSNGGRVRLATVEGGTWARDGRPFPSGSTVRGDNGLDYRLTLADGRWTAAFVAPDPVTVRLGASSDAVSIETREDGTFRMDGRAVASGDVWRAPNGNEYRFVRASDGDWSAEFVSAEPLVVTLGSSGERATLTTLEGGRFEYGGRRIGSGDTFAIPSGRRYRLQRSSAGQWSAVFVPPAPVSVRLGDSNVTVSIETRENGTFGIGDQAVASGALWKAPNGSQYRLVHAPGRGWSAEFVSAGTLVVVLGASERKATLTRLEAGVFEYNGERFRSGETFEGENGHRYRLLLSPTGVWTAVYAAPDPITVSLGSTSETVSIQETESGFTLGDVPIASGDIRKVPNGDQYRFLQDLEGRWSAEFVAPPQQRVRLGSSSLAVLVESLEGGRFRVEGGAFESGQVWEASNGDSYRLDRRTDGVWIATFVPGPPVTVTLGSRGGTLTLTRAEGGTYERNSRAFAGGTVTGNGFDYRLTLRNGEWHVEPLGRSATVALPGGGSITVMEQEDGSYQLDGNPITSGHIAKTEGQSYQLTLSGGRWNAAVWNPAPLTPADGADDIQATLVGARANLIDSEGRSARAGARLRVNGREFSLQRLFEDGEDERAGSFVTRVRDGVELARTRIGTLLGLNDDGSLDSAIETKWDEIASQLDEIFVGEGHAILGGRDTPKRRAQIDNGEVTSVLAKVVAALESESSFDDALSGGIFGDTTLASSSSTDVAELFGTQSVLERIAFGHGENTRYGAYSKRARATPGAVLEYASGVDGLGAFAYSPLERSRSLDLPRRGRAAYVGETYAAARNGDQELFVGDIELEANFSSGRVAGIVTNLDEISHGNPWKYASGDVATIRLPGASIARDDGSFAAADDATASVEYATAVGAPRPRSVASGLSGQFLSTEAEHGSNVIGTWSLKGDGEAILTGGFGADLDPAQQPVAPQPPATSDGGESSRTFLTARPDDDGEIEIEALDEDGETIKLPAASLFQDNEFSRSGPRIFASARSALEAHLSRLRLYRELALDTESLRTSLWTAANAELESIFGAGTTALGSEYPSGREMPARDVAAVRKLEDAVDALGSASDFEFAVSRPDLFATEPPSSADFDAIYAAREFELEVVYWSTDFARYGAWAQTAPSKAISPAEKSLQATGVFAYSPLAQSVHRSGDSAFATGFAARYEGSTWAVETVKENGTPASPYFRFYDATFIMTVRWSGGSADAAVSAVVEGLSESKEYDPYSYQGQGVDQIIFSGLSTSVTSGRIELDDSRHSVRVRHLDFGIADRTIDSDTSMRGKFVGTSWDGPRGVIGDWEAGDLKGAFGADFKP